MSDRERGTRKQLRFTFSLFGGLLFSMCVIGDGHARSTNTTTVYVARHAEKIQRGANPSLTAKGKQQAYTLRRIFRTTPLKAIYSTPFRRTRETAAPTARGHRMPVKILRKKPRDLARYVLARHAGQHVLVVGHSETVPAILRSLGVHDPPTIDPKDYGDLFVVKIRKDRVTMRVMKF